MCSNLHGAFVKAVVRPIIKKLFRKPVKQVEEERCCLWNEVIGSVVDCATAVIDSQTALDLTADCR